MGNKTLDRLLLGFSLCLVGCDFSNSPEVYKRLQEKPTKSISGKITHIDEEEIAIKSDQGAGSFFFEYVRMVDSNGQEKKLVCPQPTEYKTQDEITVKYVPIHKISFEEFIKEYGSNYPSSSRMNQPGYIEADGVIIK